MSNIIFLVFPCFSFEYKEDIQGVLWLGTTTSLYKYWIDCIKKRERQKEKYKYTQLKKLVFQRLLL